MVLLHYSRTSEPYTSYVIVGVMFGLPKHVWVWRRWQFCIYLVRLVLECNCVAWSPSQAVHVDRLDKLQRLFLGLWPSDLDMSLLHPQLTFLLNPSNLLIWPLGDGRLMRVFFGKSSLATVSSVVLILSSGSWTTLLFTRETQQQQQQKQQTTNIAKTIQDDYYSFFNLISFCSAKYGAYKYTRQVQIK